MGETWEELIHEADALYDEGSEEEIVEVMRRLRLVLDAEGGRDPKLAVELQFSLASGHLVFHEHDKALAVYEQIRQLAPDELELDYWQGVSLFHNWRFDEARAMLRRHRPDEGTAAGTQYYTGLLAEFAGEWKRADRLFEQAHLLDPENYLSPFRMPDHEVRPMLEELVEAMPDDVRAALQNVEVTLAPLPDPAVHKLPDVDPLVLGLYSGSSLLGTDPFFVDPMPERVEVFQRNVERVCGDRDELRHQLEVTLKHEVGHHLGWDEEDLEERGLL